MNDETEGTQVQESEPDQKVTAPGSKKAATNLLQEIASRVEALTKVKALNAAHKLADSIETNYFELGGVLRVIHDNSWHEGFDSFEQYVFETHGFQSRKAKYLMEIYTHLVTKSIPWEKVSSLGWTKLKDLARVLTPENVDEWVAKATTLTVAELQAVLKGSGGESEGGTSVKTTDDFHTLKYKVKSDQLETIQSAINKAKGETSTEFDGVALENICMGYLGGSVSIQASGGAQKTLEELMIEADWEGVLTLFDKLFPKVEIVVKPPEG